MSEPSHTIKFRTRYLIEPKFQLLFSGILVLIAFVSALLVGFIIYLLIYANNLIFIKYNVHTSPEYLSLLFRQGRLVVFAWIGSFFAVAVILFIIGIFLSHRIAGPLYALMREMKKLKEGDLSAHLELRTHDEFSEIKEPFNQWVEKFRSMTHKDIETAAKICKELQSLIEKLKMKASPQDIAELTSILDSLTEILSNKEKQVSSKS